MIYEKKKSIWIFSRKKRINVVFFVCFFWMQNVYKYDLDENAQCAHVFIFRVSTIKKFSADMMDSLRRMIIEDPRHFLMLSRTKQELLVDKLVQRMVCR